MRLLSAYSRMYSCIIFSLILSEFFLIGFDFFLDKIPFYPIFFVVFLTNPFFKFSNFVAHVNCWCEKNVQLT